MHLVRHPQRILVTGGCGFIGSAFIRMLLQRDEVSHILNLDALTYAANPENLNPYAEDPRYTFVHGSVTDSTLIPRLLEQHRIDTIVHFAAESHVDRSILGPEAFLQTNIMGTFQLLEAVRAKPTVHFHQVSTDEVYGSLGKTGYFTEQTPYDPQSPYSASKASADHLVRAYQNTFGISVTISNCSNNYGPYQFPEKLIPLMILNAYEQKPLPVYGDGSNVRDWLHVDDHCEAIWQILSRAKSGTTYNIGGQCELSNLDLIHRLLATLATKIDVPESKLKGLITFVKDRPGHDHRYAIDITNIHNDLGWQPTMRFEDGIAQTIQWYLDHQTWVDAVRDGSYRQWLEKNYQQRA